MSEKTAVDVEAQATASSTTLPPPNNTHLESEKLETSSIASSVDSADYDHDEVEAMDAGRQADLAIDRVCFQSCHKHKIHTNMISRSTPVA